MRDCLTDPPKEAGWYNVAVNGVLSFMPIYWKYNGTEWEPDSFLMDGELTQGRAGWFEGTKTDKEPYR